jgi:hypothetical protein
VPRSHNLRTKQDLGDRKQDRVKSSRGEVERLQAVVGEAEDLTASIEGTVGCYAGTPCGSGAHPKQLSKIT